MAQKNGLEAIGSLVCRTSGKMGSSSEPLYLSILTKRGTPSMVLGIQTGIRKTPNKRSASSLILCNSRGRDEIPSKGSCFQVIRITRTTPLIQMPIDNPRSSDDKGNSPKKRTREKRQENEDILGGVLIQYSSFSEEEHSASCITTKKRSKTKTA